MYPITTHSQVSELHKDPELEKMYENLEQKEIPAAFAKGTTDGPEGRPFTGSFYNVEFISPVISSVQSLIDYNYSKHQPLCDVALAQKIRNDADAKIISLKNEKRAKTSELAIALTEERIKKAECPSTVHTKINDAMKVVAALTEGGLIYLTLQGVSASTMTNILSAVIVSIAAYYGIGVAANYVVSASNLKQRRLRYLFVLGLGFIFSLSLGIARGVVNQEAININAQIEGTFVTNTSGSMFPVVIISFLAYWTCLATELRYFRNAQEKAQLKELEEKHQQVIKLGNEVSEIKQQIDAVEHEVTTHSNLLMRRQVYAAAYESRLVTLAQRIVDTYESANLNFRIDHICPDFFNQTRVFNFKLYYSTLLNHSKQPA